MVWFPGPPEVELHLTQGVPPPSAPTHRARDPGRSQKLAALVTPSSPASWVASHILAAPQAKRRSSFSQVSPVACSGPRALAARGRRHSPTLPPHATPAGADLPPGRSLKPPRRCPSPSRPQVKPPEAPPGHLGPLGLPTPPFEPAHSTGSSTVRPQSAPAAPARTRSPPRRASAHKGLLTWA